MEIEPIPNAPACLYEDSLIISDLHLGIERQYKEEGIRIPSQTNKIKEKIKDISKKKDIREIVLLGDVKNQIPTLSWQERNEIPRFLNEISNKYKVTIIPGNHDGNINKLIPNKTQNKINLETTKGTTRGDIYLFHGHTWPQKIAFSQKSIIMGHNHPLIRFEDELGRGHSEKSWIKTKLKKEGIEKRYNEEITWNNPNLIIEPAFNSLVGGVAFNSSKDNYLGPIFSSGIYDYDKMESHLIDGTYLGKLKNLKKISYNQKN